MKLQFAVVAGVLLLVSPSYGEYFFQYSPVRLGSSDFTIDGGAYGLLGGTVKRAGKVTGFVANGLEIKFLEEDLTDGRGVFAASPDLTVFLPRGLVTATEIFRIESGVRKSTEVRQHGGRAVFRGIRDHWIRSELAEGGSTVENLRGSISLDYSRYDSSLLDVDSNGAALRFDGYLRWRDFSSYVYTNGCIATDGSILMSTGSSLARLIGNNTVVPLDWSAVSGWVQMWQVPNGNIFYLEYGKHSVLVDRRMFRLSEIVKGLPLGLSLERVYMDRTSSNFYVVLKDYFSGRNQLGFVSPISGSKGTGE